MHCRGQVIRVRAPWVKNYMNNNGHFYIIPNFETVVLGGTTQKGNYDTTISPQVTVVYLFSRRETNVYWSTCFSPAVIVNLCCRTTDSKD